jgi:hypothetical protein
MLGVFNSVKAGATFECPSFDLRGHNEAHLGHIFHLIWERRRLFERFGRGYSSFQMALGS